MKPEEDLDVTLKRFWDLESVGIVAQSQEEIELTPLEKVVRKKVEQSLTYNGGQYEVAVPCRQSDQTFLTIRDKWQRRYYS